MPEVSEQSSDNTDSPQIRQINSNQDGIHENLEGIVNKHLKNKFRKPIAQHTQDAFNALKGIVETGINENKKGLIFDSCCGTGVSTKKLALLNPNSLVIGIDRSKVRLEKEYNNELPENAYLVQAECSDFWRLALNEGWKLEKHSIFYPNPYPKATHLKRRWHAHPAFPSLLALGGELELRTNWKLYAEEFCSALNIAGMACEGVNIIDPDNTMTLFEKKYKQSGHELYSCKVYLNN